MKKYDLYSVKTARQDRVDCSLAIAMVVAGLVLFADLVAYGGDSLFGQLFIWIAGLAP